MRWTQWGSQFGGGRLASSGDERRSELPWWKMTTQAAPMAWNAANRPRSYETVRWNCRHEQLGGYAVAMANLPVEQRPDPTAAAERRERELSSRLLRLYSGEDDFAASVAASRARPPRHRRRWEKENKSRQLL